MRADAARNPRVSAGVLGAGILFVVYVLSLAPDVTFWDAGEFIAASRTLGVPHPPGTPLFILLLNVWAKLLFFLPYALATNVFSACCTVVAGGVTARLVQRATGDGSMAVAAALAAGGMSSAWLNATETEVYAASLALAVVTIWTADRAGRSDHERWTYLTAYLIALAVPLHLSALVVAPVAIVLAGGSYSSAGVRWQRVAVLTGTFVLAMGIGRMSPWIAAVGAVIAFAATLIPASSVVTQPPLLSTADPWSVMTHRSDGPRVASSVIRRTGLPLGTVLLVFLASSAVLFMYVRAQFDPGINQGNPDTLGALADVIARRQYAVSPMWPREAPVWVQLANFGQYADWQVALSFGPTVLPSILRTLGTVIFLALGYRGAITLWRVDRRFSIATLALFLCGALGVLVYLNLHAGPSIGYGILPADTVREARERDYFFVFAFWTWGLWAGIGAVSMASRWSRPAWTGVLVASLPIVMNWRAVTRRGEPEQSLPRVLAHALLESAPRNAVLFVMGDNDSYPLWYAQQVLRVRPDVAVVTIPLLPTEWYRSELSRRHFLLTERDVERFDGKLNTAAAIADGARRLGRPVATAITMRHDERGRIGVNWTPSGLTYVEGRAPLDTVAARRWAAWVEQRLPSGELRPAIDPVNDYFRKLLDCPRQFLAYARNADSSRLDSVCNYR